MIGEWHRSTESRCSARRAGNAGRQGQWCAQQDLGLIITIAGLCAACRVCCANHSGSYGGEIDGCSGLLDWQVSNLTDVCANCCYEAR